MYYTDTSEVSFARGSLGAQTFLPTSRLSTQREKRNISASSKDFLLRTVSRFRVRLIPAEAAALSSTSRSPSGSRLPGLGKAPPFPTALPTPCPWLRHPKFARGKSEFGIHKPMLGPGQTAGTTVHSVGSALGTQGLSPFSALGSGACGLGMLTASPGPWQTGSPARLSSELSRSPPASRLFTALLHSLVLEQLH